MSAESRPAIFRSRLDNGLQVVLQPDPSLPLAAVNVWYHVGSKNERPGRTGLAHLFEHMLFQGSEHVAANEHFRLLQQVGGVANGSTFFDRTNYYETVPSRHLELALWLEADRMGHLLPALDAEKLERQREVVLNERRQRVDNRPYGRAFERLNELLYPGEHPYHWPVIGYSEDIAAADLDDVRAFFTRYYRPANAVLSLVGDFAVDDAVALVARQFGHIPAGLRPRPVAAPTAPLDGEARESMPDDVALPRLYIGYRAPPITDASQPALDVLAAALAGGKSSPLYEELVHRRQIAQDVQVLVLSMELSSTLLAVATGGPGGDLGPLDAAVTAALERIAGGELEPGDLERARKRLLAALHGESQSFEVRADRLGELATFFDDPERLDREPEIYAAVTAADVVAAAADLLTRSPRAVVEVVPEPGA